MGKAKMDKYLTEVLKEVGPEEELYIIVGFHKDPTEKQLEQLAAEGMEITHNYVPFLNAVAGRLPARSVDKIRQYNFIKDLELSGKARL